MQLTGVGMGTTPATTNTAPAPAPPPNTLGAGLSVWTNPLGAVQDIPGAVGLLGSSSYGTFAMGILIPVAAVVALLLFSGGSGGGGRRH